MSWVNRIMEQQILLVESSHTYSVERFVNELNEGGRSPEKLFEDRSLQ